MSLCLAVTCHDPAGSFARGVEASRDTVARIFDAIAVNATRESAPSTISALQATGTPTRQRSHGAGTVGIGTARRDAVALALETNAAHIVYSDLDHVLRWASADPDELARSMTPKDDTDLTVIGRSRKAFGREPQRLQRTEGVVNHVASMLLGTRVTGGETWDFMIAVRLMTRECAQLLVDGSTEDSIANDVSWPLSAHKGGLRVAYLAVDGLAYRFRDDFAATADTRDDDPAEWIKRLEIAAQHAVAMRSFL